MVVLAVNVTALLTNAPAVLVPMLTALPSKPVTLPTTLPMKLRPVILPAALINPSVSTLPLIALPTKLKLVPVAAPMLGVVKLAPALTMIFPPASNAVVSLSTLALN